MYFKSSFCLKTEMSKLFGRLNKQLCFLLTSYVGVAVYDGKMFLSWLVLLVRVWWLLLTILNCFCSIDLVFDHLVIFDLGTICHWYPDWKLILEKCTDIPEQVRLQHAYVPVALRSKVFSYSELVSLIVCLFSMHSNIWQLIHWHILKFLIWNWQWDFVAHRVQILHNCPDQRWLKILFSHKPCCTAEYLRSISCKALLAVISYRSNNSILLAMQINYNKEGSWQVTWWWSIRASSSNNFKRSTMRPVKGELEAHPSLLCFMYFSALCWFRLLYSCTNVEIFCSVCAWLWSDLIRRFSFNMV